MSRDLGTWGRAQAEALVRVLAENGIEADTERTADGIRVTVQPDDAARASRVMSARMEEIAAAAEIRRTARAPRWFEDDDDDEEGRPLLMERFRRLGAVLGVLIAGLMVAFYVPGPFRIVAAFLTFLVIGLFIARGRNDADDEDRTYGPGA